MFRIEKVSPEDWKHLAGSAHVLSFGERRDSNLDRVSFALLAVDELEKPAGYVTCIEMDKETLYWQYGGAFPDYLGTIHSLSGYKKFVGFCSEMYKRVTTKIENNNLVMLKFAMKLGFKIVGVENFNGKILVNLTNEFIEEK